MNRCGSYIPQTYMLLNHGGRHRHYASLNRAF